jgi:hypothetical protein
LRYPLAYSPFHAQVLPFSIFFVHASLASAAFPCICNQIAFEVHTDTPGRKQQALVSTLGLDLFDLLAI